MDFRAKDDAWYSVRLRNPTRYTPSKDSPISSQLQDMNVDAGQELQCEIRTVMRANIDGDKLSKRVSAVLVAVAGQELRCGSQDARCILTSERKPSPVSRSLSSELLLRKAVLIAAKRGPKPRREEKSRREQLLLDHRRNTAGTSSELRRSTTGASPEHHRVPEGRRSSARRRSNVRILPDAGILPDARVTPEFFPSDARILPDTRVTSELCLAL
ncbi:hypothetical protein IEQ34_012491 [Dendrobium chrysotoxum]|uniref:Uncharacterized protein n=1 Tax=Dendrobium chrysotoxum TaxID=161865 RepID=A0AAV7GVT2_DENCH|nr:hypothetical protein IEQ34_012491 [Dendrobium chrysotoxum]